MLFDTHQTRIVNQRVAANEALTDRFSGQVTDSGHLTLRVTQFYTSSMAHTDEIAEDGATIISAREPNLEKQIDSDIAVDSVERANFWILSIHHVAMRVGWIFKTESVVMPAVLDSIGGSSWLRGFLPMLSRMGQSLPSLLVSDHMSRSSLKKHWLVGSSLIMGILFLILAAVWNSFTGKPPVWLPAAFLLIYGLFFAATGINQVALGTLHGKLVPVTKRGRLMLVSNIIGSICSITCAWFLLQQWIQEDATNFVAIFIACGILFVLGGIIAWWTFETPDQQHSPSIKLSELGPTALRILKSDKQFRLLAIVAGCFGMSISLFPHYQSLAIQRLELNMTSLIPWLIAQNIGVGAMSFPAGSLADRFGNLLVLRLEMAFLCISPVMALAFASMGNMGANLYVLVFIALGLTPLTMRTLKNFALELTTRQQQPVYLSTLMICMAIPPILFSLLVGLLIDQAGYEWAFGFVLLFMIPGWMVTLKMIDPRNSSRP